MEGEKGLTLVEALRLVWKRLRRKRSIFVKKTKMKKKKKEMAVLGGFIFQRDWSCMIESEIGSEKISGQS